MLAVLCLCACLSLHLGEVLFALLQLAVMELVVWNPVDRLPARLVVPWPLVESPLLSLCGLLALLALSMSGCARLAMWGYRVARKSKGSSSPAWQRSSENKTEETVLKGKSGAPFRQFRRRKAEQSKAGPSRMMSPRKRKPRSAPSGNVQFAAGVGDFQLPPAEVQRPCQAVAEQALRFDSPPLASAPARILLEKQGDAWTPLCRECWTEPDQSSTSWTRRRSCGA